MSSTSNGPNSASKPQENISQLYSTSGSNSWTVGMRTECRAKKQESYANQTANSGTISWALLNEEVSLIKKQAVKPTYALKSIPRETYSNKPLPPIPETPPPPYTPRLTPGIPKAHKPYSPFRKTFLSLNFVTRLKKQTIIEPNKLLADLSNIQFDQNFRDVADAEIPTALFPYQDEQVIQCQEETSGALHKAQRSENVCPEISAEPSSANKSNIAQLSDANPSADEKQRQLSVSDSPSGISSSSLVIPNFDHSSSTVSLVGQLASKTDPTTRHFLENRIAFLKISGRYRNRSGILRESGVRKLRRASTLSETPRVRFASIDETRGDLSQPRIVENKVCMNNKQGQNKEKITIPCPNHSPTELSEETTAYSESNHCEKKRSKTVGIN